MVVREIYAQPWLFYTVCYGSGFKNLHDQRALISQNVIITFSFQIVMTHCTDRKKNPHVYVYEIT